MKRLTAALLLAVLSARVAAVDRFPLADVRLGPGPFLEAQRTDLQYLMAQLSAKF